MSETIQEENVLIEETMKTSAQNEEVVVRDSEKCNIRAFQWFYDRNFNKFFEFVRAATSEKSVQVRCVHCPPSKMLTVTANSAFNLNSHFKSVHKAINQKFIDATKKRKLDDEAPNNSEPKQMKLSSEAFVGQRQLDQLVLDYIIEKVLPFSSVESKSFKRLVLSGKSSKLQVITRKKLVGILVREFNILKDGQISEYSEINYFCLTADLWSSRRRAFLGVTIHWICPKTFSRKKSALACQRIKGKHTGDVLAAHIDEIIKSFRIPIRKILKIITDGGSNFKKAFKEHQHEDETFVDDDDDIEDLTEILSESDNDRIFLPPHGRCASHSLCLISTSDLKLKKPRATKKKAEKVNAFDSEYKVFRETILDPVFAKCQELFNKQQHSSKAADLIHSYLNRYLVTPSPTRWNSLFDSVVVLSTLLDRMPEQMLSVTNGLGLERITTRDHTILKEYIRLMENIANALDILQGEKYMYQGVFSPTIHKMKQKINDVQGLTYCLPVKTQLLNSIEKRFPDAMKDDNLKAALLHPLFKSYPMFTDAIKRRLVSELAVELQENLDKNKSIEKENLSSSKNNRSDIENLSTFKKLFDYDIGSGFSGTQPSSIVNAEIILHNYLSSADASIDTLTRFPDVGKLFIKYNTTMCSSAACERLFSLAKHVLRADRCQITDEHFEAQLVLKANLFPSKACSNNSDSVEIVK